MLFKFYLGMKQTLYIHPLISLLLFLFLIQSSSIFAQKRKVIETSSSLPVGAYHAGFRIIQLYDYSRSYKEEVDYFGKVIEDVQNRPIQAYIWYPTKRVKRPKYMPYKKYVEAQFMRERYQRKIDKEQHKHIKQQSLELVDAMLYSIPTTISAEELLNKKTKALWEADPIKERFPLVIYAPSYSSTPMDNAMICEYLASHGYIVAAVPSAGKEQQEMSSDLEGLLAQVEDMEELKGFMQTRSNVQISKIGSWGYSWGGAANVLFQMRNTYVDAVLSYDGSMEYFYDLVKDLYFFNTDKTRVPYLFMAKGNSFDTTYQFYHSLKYADAYCLKFNELEHPDFSSFTAYVASHDPQSEQYYNEQNFEGLALYTLHFFNASLKDDDHSKHFLSKLPIDHGFADSLLSKNFKHAQKAPPTEAQFFYIIENYGFSRAYKEYKYFQRHDPAFQIFSEANLNTLGYKYLYEKEDTKTAVQIFQLNTEIFPESYNVYDSLAEAFTIQGDKEQAIVNYEKSLTLNPANWKSAEQLKQLQQELEEDGGLIEGRND